jgi:hypothetical protein
MVFPSVTEIPLPLEPVDHDPFLDALPIREADSPDRGNVVVLPRRESAIAIAA